MQPAARAIADAVPVLQAERLRLRAPRPGGAIDASLPGIDPADVVIHRDLWGAA